MKQKNKYTKLTIYQGEIPAYPNAASNSYFFRKILDITTAVVSGIGLVTAMIVLITLT